MQHKIICTVLVLLLGVIHGPLQAQNLGKGAIKSLQRVSQKNGAQTLRLTNYKNRLNKTLSVVLQNRVAQAVPLQVNQSQIVQASGIMELTLPKTLDAQALYPLAQAAAFIVNPNNPQERALTERWFKQNTRYAQKYAQNKTASAKEMTAYYVAWLYSTCVQHQARYPGYRLLENALNAKYGFLKYKDLYSEL